MFVSQLETPELYTFFHRVIWTELSLAHLSYSRIYICFEHNPTLKVSKFQNEFMKSKFEPNIERISALYCATLQGRNPYNFWFIFWEK